MENNDVPNLLKLHYDFIKLTQFCKLYIGCGTRVLEFINVLENNEFCKVNSGKKNTVNGLHKHSPS